MPLITKDRKIHKGFIRERKALKWLLKPEECEECGEAPKMARQYKRGMAQFLGVPEGKINQSEPFKNYLKRLRK